MQTDTQDTLQLGQQPNIISQLQPKEQIKFSTLIKKINEEKMVQQRIFLLTSNSIYNIAKRSSLIKSLVSKLISLQSKYTIKRKISLKQLYGITLSKSRENGQFVVHVIDDYDYRYCAESHEKKVLILKKICQLYSLNNNGKKLPFYFKDQILLYEYATRKSDLKTNIDRKPKEDPVFLGEEDFQQYELPDLNYKLEFNMKPEDSNVTMKQFKPIFQIEQLKPNLQYYTVQSTEIDLKSIMQVVNFESQIFLKPQFIFSTKSKVQLLIPFMIGGNLGRKLKKSVRISEQLAWFYIAQLIIMIEQLHQNNIWYPNFSLQKIFISQNGYLKLLAIQKDIICHPDVYSKRHYDILGYAQYMAPEMILIKGYELMDIYQWKLGVCVHQLLLGYFPFEGKTSKQIYHSIMKKKLKSELPDFLHKLLDKNPKKRMSLSQLKKIHHLANIDWQKLKKQTLSAPYQPDTSGWKGNLPAIVQFNRQVNSTTSK